VEATVEWPMQHARLDFLYAIRIQVTPDEAPDVIHVSKLLGQNSR